jgi:hypothetical protein
VIEPIGQLGQPVPGRFPRWEGRSLGVEEAQRIDLPPDGVIRPAHAAKVLVGSGFPRVVVPERGNDVSISGTER